MTRYCPVDDARGAIANARRDVLCGRGHSNTLCKAEGGRLCPCVTIIGGLPDGTCDAGHGCGLVLSRGAYGHTCPGDGVQGDIGDLYPVLSEIGGVPHTTKGGTGGLEHGSSAYRNARP